MCEHCEGATSSLLPLGSDDQGCCEVCGQPASWLLIERSVLFHICEAHLAEQRKQWEEDEALYRGAGMTFITEFLPVRSPATCGYRLPGPVPGTPGPACGAPASHVEVESDRHYYCEEDRPV